MSHTVHHGSSVRKLYESVFLWLSAVFYCSRFGSVQLANEAKKQAPFSPLSAPPFPLSSPFSRLFKVENICPTMSKIIDLQRRYGRLANNHQVYKTTTYKTIIGSFKGAVYNVCFFIKSWMLIEFRVRDHCWHACSVVGEGKYKKADS